MCHNRFTALLYAHALISAYTAGSAEAYSPINPNTLHLLAMRSPIPNLDAEGNEKLLTRKNKYDAQADSRRRDILLSTAASTLGSFVGMPVPSVFAADTTSPNLIRISDPNTYSALAYAPPPSQSGSSPPLLIVLPGAARNEDGDAWALADIAGDHRGLPASLLASGTAPSALSEKFAVVSPYSGKNVPSFYDEARSKLLSFIDWVGSPEGRAAGCPTFDPQRIFLFGFSDGATEAVELLTTGRFRGAVVAAYGFTGDSLPQRAVERLKGIPLWVFHSADDVIFNVRCSDRLVESLRKVNGGEALVQYTRFDKDQEGFTGRVRGHSTGITAAKRNDVYEWMLSL